MKKMLSMIAAIALGVSLLPTCYADTRNDFKTRAAKFAGKEIIQNFYEDFDGDGTPEMFAFAGEIYFDEELYIYTFQGKIVYVSNEKTEIIAETEKGGLGVIIEGYYDPEVITQDIKKVLVYHNTWNDETIKSTILSVENDTPVSFKMDTLLRSSTYGLLIENVANDMIIKKSDMQKGNYSGTGSTRKMYYHYWDSDKGTLKEYGAIPITEQQFLEFKDADKILNSITDGKVYNILYRKNGLININIYKETNNDSYEFKNLTVAYEDDTVTVPKTISYEDGLYLEALNPDNAVYPEFKSSAIKVLLNGKAIKFDQSPIMAEGDRVMVPIRAIFEALGYTLSWDQATQTATAVKEDSELVVKEGLSGVHLNGEWIPFDAPNINVSERILVPVRIISECAGANVAWDGTNKTVVLTY